MIMNRLFFIIITHVTLLLAFSMAACQKDEDIHDLSGTVVLELREHAADGLRKLGLYAETKEEYPCLNFAIEFEYTQASNSRHIHFLGVKAPRVCLTALGPAKTFLNLGEMDDGVHELQFMLNEEYSVVNLLVSEELVEVKMISAHPKFLIFREHELYRLTNSHAWGYIHAKSTEPDKEMELFFLDLWDLGATEETLEPGNYGYFRITDEAWYYFDHMHQYQPQNPFVIQFDDEFDQLRDLADEYSEHFVIVLYDAQGHYHHNQQ